MMVKISNKKKVIALTMISSLLLSGVASAHGEIALEINNGTSTEVKESIRDRLDEIKAKAIHRIWAIDHIVVTRCSKYLPVEPLADGTVVSEPKDEPDLGSIHCNPTSLWVGIWFRESWRGEKDVDRDLDLELVLL